MYSRKCAGWPVREISLDPDEVKPEAVITLLDGWKVRLDGKIHEGYAPGSLLAGRHSRVSIPVRTRR